MGDGQGRIVVGVDTEKESVPYPEGRVAEVWPFGDLGQRIEMPANGL